MESITTVFTSITGFMGDMVAVMVAPENLILTIPIAIGLGGAAIGLIKRLTGR